MKNLTFTLALLTLISCGHTGKSRQELVRFENQWSSPYRADSKLHNQLVNDEGKYLFILNKTEWAYFACGNPEDVINKAKKHGANVIRVQLEGTPYFDYLGYDIWPWGGTRKQPDFTTFNSKYWDEVERRITLAGKNGIGIDMVLYFTLKPKVEDIGLQKLYWDQIISRLSKYSNILNWEIMNEYIANEAFQDSAGIYFKTNDPFHHPVSSSDGTTEDALWPQKQWMDLAIVHTCTGQTGYDLESWYLSVARNTRQHGKPAFNNETGREKRHKNDDPVNRRKQAWLFNNSGCFWTWHSWDGCEGINDTSYFFDGWQYLKPMRDFYESLPFWTLQPNYSVCSFNKSDLVYATLSSPDRKTSVVYCCTKKTGGNAENEKAAVRIKDGTYSLRFLNPSTLSVISETIYESKGLRIAEDIKIPSFRDDILILINEKVGKEKVPIKGTL